ncbi:MAG: zinc-binding dehydrogenase [Marinoscillum sp.]|uniref:zinc-binding dehydrogenase n=1 Tax=Marinoscillum sp. TaxID=2024838 RepID=UPI0032F15AF4
MKAVVLNPKNNQLEYQETAEPAISKSDVLIRLKAASLNHHELWSLKEKKLQSDTRIIMGSDGAGVVEQVGSGVTRFSPGDEVIINPSMNWGPDHRVQHADYEILGFPTNGTFAERVSIPEEYVLTKPAHLSFEEAAAIPLAGLTAYRALFTRGEFEPGQSVLITGIGGGAALMALSFAVAAGASVYVTSGSDHKITKAVALGAKGGVNYKAPNWHEQLQALSGGFDVIIDSAGGPGFKYLTEIANPGARIVLFGRTAGMIQDISPRVIFWKQLSIHGTSMGTSQEFEQMLKLFSDRKIHPVIDAVYPLEQINEAFDRMDNSDQFGKIVMKITA